MPAPIAPAPVAELESAVASEPSAEDRRVHKRHARDEMPSCKARLKFGPAVTLIDVSNGGAQIETTNYRIQPGSTVVLEITGERGDVAVPATVLRCQLASLLPEPIYRGALVFKQDFDVRTLGAASVEPEPATDVDPASALAELLRAIERLAIGAEVSPTPEVIAPLLSALTAAHATLETPAGRRAGVELERHLVMLFQSVTRALQRTPTPAALQAAIVEHLRQVVPAHAIHVAEAGAAAPAHGAEAILLSIPRLSSETPAARLSVEFPDGAEPQELDLLMLKAGVQLIALGRELGRLNGDDRPLRASGPQPLPDGWRQVVACYANGKTRSGFTAEFTPTKGCLELASEPTPSSKPLTVPLTELRTIRFAKDPAREGDRAASVAAAKGRKLRVTFPDGQLLEGTTDSYRRSAPGFFVQPLDPQSDAERVFVIGSSTLQVVFG